MELYLIRHGQSANNATEETGQRVCDPPLTEIGREQARLVAEWLRDLNRARVSLKNEAEAAKRLRERLSSDGKGLRLTRLYTSPMLRALETTEAIRGATGLIPYVWIDVHEVGGIWLDHGDGRGQVGLQGMGRAEMRERFPHFVLPAGVREEGWWNRPYEGDESGHDRARRVAEELREMAETDERVGIVSHGGFGSYLIDVLLGLPFTPHIRFSMNNTSVCRLILTPGGTGVRFLNRVDHLPGELVT